MKTLLNTVLQTGLHATHFALNTSKEALILSTEALSATSSGLAVARQGIREKLAPESEMTKAMKGLTFKDYYQAHHNYQSTLQKILDGRKEPVDLLQSMVPEKIGDKYKAIGEDIVKDISPKRKVIKETTAKITSIINRLDGLCDITLEDGTVIEGTHDKAKAYEQHVIADEVVIVMTALSSIKKFKPEGLKNVLLEQNSIDNRLVAAINHRNEVKQLNSRKMKTIQVDNMKETAIKMTDTILSGTFGTAHYILKEMADACASTEASLRSKLPNSLSRDRLIEQRMVRTVQKQETRRKSQAYVQSVLEQSLENFKKSLETKSVTKVTQLQPDLTSTVKHA